MDLLAMALSSFETPLLVEITQKQIQGRTLARIINPFSYRVGPVDFIRVPKGFETDFASVPRALWAVVPPLGRYAKAAVIHDWLYYRQDRSRKEADLIFFEAMRVLGVGRARRNSMYWAVRQFGWIVWNRRKK